MPKDDSKIGQQLMDEKLELLSKGTSNGRKKVEAIAEQNLESQQEQFQNKLSEIINLKFLQQSQNLHNKIKEEIQEMEGATTAERSYHPYLRNKVGKDIENIALFRSERSTLLASMNHLEQDDKLQKNYLSVQQENEDFNKKEDVLLEKYLTAALDLAEARITTHKKFKEKHNNPLNENIRIDMQILQAMLQMDKSYLIGIKNQLANQLLPNIISFDNRIDRLIEELNQLQQEIQPIIKNEITNSESSPIIDPELSKPSDVTPSVELLKESFENLSNQGSPSKDKPPLILNSDVEGKTKHFENLSNYEKPPQDKPPLTLKSNVSEKIAGFENLGQTLASTQASGISKKKFQSSKITALENPADTPQKTSLSNKNNKGLVAVLKQPLSNLDEKTLPQKSSNETKNETPLSEMKVKQKTIGYMPTWLTEPKTNKPMLAARKYAKGDSPIIPVVLNPADPNANRYEYKKEFKVNQLTEKANDFQAITHFSFKSDKDMKLATKHQIYLRMFADLVSTTPLSETEKIIIRGEKEFEQAAVIIFKTWGIDTKYLDLGSACDEAKKLNEEKNYIDFMYRDLNLRNLCQLAMDFQQSLSVFIARNRKQFGGSNENIPDGVSEALRSEYFIERRLEECIDASVEKGKSKDLSPQEEKREEQNTLLSSPKIENKYT